MYNPNNQNNQNNIALAETASFILPAPMSGDFTAEDLAEDMEGLQISFPQVKIPSGGVLQFEMASDDPERPDYVAELEGVILYNHASNAYCLPVRKWPKSKPLRNVSASSCVWNSASAPPNGKWPLETAGRSANITILRLLAF